MTEGECAAEPVGMHRSKGGRPLRILIVRVGAMGDVLHGMPAVAGLRAALPGCVIGWAVDTRWEPLLRGANGSMPLVDRVHGVDTRQWSKMGTLPATAGKIAQLRQELKRADYDVCIDLQGSIRSAVIARMPGARRIAGWAEPREWPARIFYTELYRPTVRNVIGQACELVSAGLRMQVAPAEVMLPVDQQADLWSQKVIGDDALPGKRTFILLAPTAGWGAKEWGTERYVGLAQRLMSEGWRVLVNAVPGGRSEVAEVAGAEAVVSTVPQLIALTRRAELVIGGDTGPVHLAAALGRPVVALFGPTDPARNGPAFVGAKVRALRDASSVTSHQRLAATEAGLQRIRVEGVLEAALDMLQERWE